MNKDELRAMLQPAVDDAIDRALSPPSPFDVRYEEIRKGTGEEPWWVTELADRIPDLNAIETSPALKAYLDEHELTPDAPDDDNDGVKPL